MPRVKIRHIALRLGLPLVFAFACGLCAISFAAQTLNQSRHIVIVVWDGMRPDLVTERGTPALWKLAHEGVTFRNHHSVYPSATMVNGTAIVTGVYPGENGIIANHVYRQEIDPRHAIDVEIPSVVSKGDDLSGGKYISVPTIAEFIQRAGGPTVIAAAKAVGLLLGRHVPRGSSKPSEFASPLAEGERMKVRGSGSVTLFAGKSLPGDALGPITDVLGPFPSGHVQQDAWTTKAVTDFLLKDGVPTLSILWLGEPDLTQHESAPGAPAALTAIKSADENLAAVLSALDRQKARETTDLFVVSDHGFSTLSRFDMHNTLIAAGPDFRRGEADDLPSGNVDLAPTILRILGITSLRQLDGRILSEAMTDSDPATATLKPENKMIEATKAFPSGSWRQSLQSSRV